MSRVRPEVYTDDFSRYARAGDGLLMAAKVAKVTTAGNLTITAEAIKGGVAMFTGAAGAVTYTSPTGTQLDEIFSDMDIGETHAFILSNTAAQAATIAGGTNVTAEGNLVVNATAKVFVLEKTAAATYKLYGL